MTYTKQAAIQPTKKRGLWASLSLSSAAILLMGLANPAAAHVEYADLSDPNQSPGGVNSGSFTDNGWYQGTTPQLGDSHGLAGGTFYSFHLAQIAGQPTQYYSVNLNFKDYSNTGLLNPAFTLYSGLLPTDSHDDTIIDPLNPSHFVTTPAPAHNVKDASPVDTGLVADANGNISPFRDTAHIVYNGQFDALHSWSMATAGVAGEWAVIDYLTHVGPTGGNSVSLLNYLLPSGDYTIAAGGGNAISNGNELTGILTFNATVTAVPLPASVWLFASALAGLGACRKKHVA